MSGSISDSHSTKLSSFVEEELGLCFPRDRFRDLERGIRMAAVEFDFQDPAACIDWLLSSRLTKRQLEILAGSLTVGETYFMRDGKVFEILEEVILPELIHKREMQDKRLRIWSAGCCSGEEPYSMGMVLERTLPDLREWNVTLLATDINPLFLQKAKEGLYGEWSFRVSPEWVKEHYFEKKGTKYQIKDSLKRLVTFSYLNLAQDSYPSLVSNTNAIDIIFCRNVLMYFSSDRVKRVADHLHRCLVDGGWLIVSPSEASSELFSKFQTVKFPDAFLYRKGKSFSPGASNAFRSPSAPPESSAMALPPLPLIETQQTLPESDTVELSNDARSLLVSEESNPIESTPDQLQDALMYYQQGHYAEAAETVTGYLKEQREDVTAIELLARSYANLGKLKEAERWCDEALQVDKLDIGIHFLKATVLEEQGNISAAKESLQRALYLDQNFVLGELGLANLAKREGKLSTAQKHFQNAKKLLQHYRHDEVLPESEGMTAGSLLEIISTSYGSEPL